MIIFPFKVVRARGKITEEVNKVKCRLRRENLTEVTQGKISLFPVFWVRKPAKIMLIYNNFVFIEIL